MKVYLSIFWLLVIFSCGKKTKESRAFVQKDSLTFISTSKKMAKIEGGTYKAFFGQDSGNVVKVKSFYIDDSPVTNREYLQFLKANPQWSKKQILKLYADSSYLKNWTDDMQPPKGISLDAPVTNVSWYAAKAYAKSVGKRLPTVDEWEFVGIADEVSKNASEDPKFTESILQSYKSGEKFKIPIKLGQPNYYGVYDLYGLVWEWTEDFNSVMMSGESRKDNSKNESLFCAGASVTSNDLRNYAAFIRFAMRGSVKANYCISNMGFRCAKDAND